MPGGVLTSVAHDAVVDEFFSAAAVGPAALLVEGEAGIGKTTLWLDVLERARARRLIVMSAGAAAAESVMAYASLADLLADVEPAVTAQLPTPQRLGIDRVLLKSTTAEVPTDPRAVAAGFLSIVETLAETAPVLIAIDDLQWLDSSSVSAIAFATRRLSGRVGILGTVRTEPGSDHASWLRLPTPQALRRIQIPPLSLGAMHAMIRQRLGRSFPRPAMVRIRDISNGNPFYALELARAMDSAKADVTLPSTLAELVGARLGGLSAAVRKVLLAVACVATPTLEVISRATDADVDAIVESLEEAEAQGIVELDGCRVRFAHPLLAAGVYSGAPPAERRAMHRSLAQCVSESELKARHLALAATSSDPDTLDSLDRAAEMACLRGAPAAAAELLDLAIGLGGDTPQRRITAASHHFKAGDPAEARRMLEATIRHLGPGPLRAEALSQLGFVRLFDDSFLEAADLLQRALAEMERDCALRVHVLVTLAFAQLNAGRLEDAWRNVQSARTIADEHDQPQLLSQALGMGVILRFLRGDGLEESDLRRALELEHRQTDIPIGFRPSMQHAILLGWTGQLDDAHREITTVRRRCVEHGQENELMLVSLHSVLIEMWRGNFADATLIAEDAMERALLLGGDIPLSIALMIRAALASYRGEIDDARRDANDALAASVRHGSHILAIWPVTTLGFIEVSLGNYEAALTTLEPLRAIVSATPSATEIVPAWALPDAAEALISLGRLDEAAPLVDVLERNGARLDRPWMLAVGGRCRAMLSAARGDLDEASAAIEQAMRDHQRLPMPFERARSQLLHGQLQRRQKHKGEAATTLREVLGTFERLGAPLWAERAKTELARATLDLERDAQLTPSEQRVAELVASGMTNRDIGGALFISPKTVEANLSRIYRKLNIRSRAELARRIGSLSAGDSATS